MYVSNIVVLSFALASWAAPTTSYHKRADVLTFRPYNEFQISNGIAGNALAEVNKDFPVRYTIPDAISVFDRSSRRLFTTGGKYK
jgi:hypothetical protein